MRRALKALSAAAAAAAALVFLSWVLIASVHVNDSFYVHQVSGVWLALAGDVQRGLFYPPLYDGHAFGGTRYMPGQILVYAGAGEAVRDPVLGAKLAVYLTALLLLAVLFASLRTVGCSLSAAAGLTAAAVATGVGLLAVTAVGGDTLPVVLQLGALLLLSRRDGRRAAAAAGVLCALAFLTKLTALWAPAAVVVWLVWRGRARLPAFGAAFGAATSAGLVTAELTSSGRFSENLLGVSSSSFMGLDAVLVDAPGKLLTLAHGNATAIVVLAPLVVASLVIAALERRASVYHLSFVLALGVLVVALADAGAYYNHLVDVCVLAVILVGDLWQRAGGGGGGAAFRVVVLSGVVWAGTFGWFVDVKPAAAEAARLLSGRADRATYAKEPPSGVFRDTDEILSDDPYVPVALGDRPVVLDAFQLLRLVDEHPEWRRALVKRIERREFDKVVLLLKLDRSEWWRETHLGLPIVDAIDRNYTLGRRLREWRDLWIYVPR